MARKSESGYDIPRTPTVDELERKLLDNGVDGGVAFNVARMLLDEYIVRCK